jgi:hypothetical protein
MIEEKRPKWALWIIDKLEDVTWFFSDFENIKALLGLAFLIVVFGAIGILGYESFNVNTPVGPIYTGEIVGHAITGEDRDTKVIPAVGSDGEITTVIVPGESKKKTIAIDIGIRVIEMNTDTTTYYRTALGDTVFVQEFESPRGWISVWRILLDGPNR